VLHGLEATGKSSITKALLEELSTLNDQVNGNTRRDRDTLRYAIVKSAECIVGRHLMEQTVGAVARALGSGKIVGRCENLAQLVVEIGNLVEDWTVAEEHRRLVLVFDGIDHQKEAPPTLLPALARLGEIVSQA
jgi:origin recognition complex subunit 5